MTEIGRAYGEALYTLAREKALSHLILSQLNVLRAGFAREPNFLHLLSSPNLPKIERCGILDNCFRSRLHAYVLNFLKILTEQGRIRHFPDCVRSYRELYNRDNGILPVTAVTAVVLTDSQADRLKQKLCHITGKRIELTNKSDPEVLGGIRLDYDGKRVDATVSHRLDALRRMLQSTVL